LPHPNAAINGKKITNVGIRRASCLVLAEEVRENALAILGCEVHRLELDSDDVGDSRGVDEIGARRAVFVGVVILPVLHEQPTTS
jgi:hypothetical protein